MKAPFPYFGGKARAAHLVWERFGDPPNYVEPFFGSGAVLLSRDWPHSGTETVNDADGLLANFWRALQADPSAVADHADWPVNENDLHARHAWLVGRKDRIQAKLEGDPDWFDAKAAGWWVWGISAWIGSGWCSGKGPWQSVEIEDGTRQLVHLGNAGRGVNRKREELQEYFHALADRLRDVRVCCGDWSRVCGPSVLRGAGTPCAIFLDPPYADTADRDSTLYRIDSESVAHEVREWAIREGDNKDYRIALCGYENEHVMPDSWECVEWKANGGYGSQSLSHDNPNARKERIWFSPHCVKPEHERQPLFARITDAATQLLDTLEARQQ